MPALLVLAFVVVPLVELAVILQVGQVIGTWPTIALLVIDSVAGALLLRHESRRAWQEFRRALEAGRWPGDEVTQGALVIVGGTLLLTPGFVTDAVGLLLLLPPTRAILSRLIRRRLNPLAPPAGASRPPRGDTTGRRRTDRGDAPAVLDVEVVDVQRDPPDPDPLDGTPDARD
jgi:UPF0716 protein FxsA